MNLAIKAVFSHDILKESSGFPKGPDCSMAEKLAYIEEVRQKEGIELDIANIRKNLAARAVAKLLLNSLWGLVLSEFLPCRAI